MKKLFDAGNFKEALAGYKKLVLNPMTDPKRVSEDLTMAVSCLQQLGSVDEVDALLEDSIAVHRQNWRYLEAAAKTYLEIEHEGFIVAGTFSRGGRRGNDGKFVNCADRDRVRALQLLEQALPLANADADKPAVARFYQQFASALLLGRSWNHSWKLQILTEVTQLPDYEESYWNNYNTGIVTAPVDAEGAPVLYHLPNSYDAAANDGERWRWMLAQTVENNPSRRNEVDLSWADFLHSQFGVQTLAAYGWQQDDDGDEQDQNESGTYALHTLNDGETIAKLATGIKRFPLADEFNPIKNYEAIAARGKSTQGESARTHLAQIYADRRQYVKAAAAWRLAIQEYGPGDNKWRANALQQIVGNWGRFDHGQPQPAGRGATVEYRFRNGSHVSFEAWEIDVAKFLTDAKAYLQQKPKQLDWRRLNVDDFGYTLITENQNQYIKGKVAAWEMAVKPRAEHVDDRVTVTTPLQKAGAYLVTAKMAYGNVARIIVWVADTVIARKTLDSKTAKDRAVLYYVADAVTGLPIEKANVEFFGWRQTYNSMNRENRISVQNFADFTDKDGQLMPSVSQLSDQYQWLTIARGGNGEADRLAFLGFSGIWYGQSSDQAYDQVKTFAITDRPVYRPDQPVKFKFWVQHSRYDEADKSAFANKSFTAQINNPQGEKVYDQKLKADEFGGLEGEYALPKGVQLGVYQVFIVDHGGGSFRVEEYKKPEFEVTVEAPKEPIRLGEKVSAKIEAKYLFGAPVTKAKVKYRVLRSAHNSNWYPLARWDWFYGKGYWWFAYDYDWYPGWSRWGCIRPIGWWWGSPSQPPEVVAEQEVEIGADGTVSVEIDTQPAKALHGNQDHKYSITAEVVDESRRTIVGTGEVLVARQPFRVFAWVHRGHYRVGDVVEAQFQAHTLDQQPVAGQGELTLYKITYDEKQEPVEKAVQTWKLDTNVEGSATQQLKADAAGQYRLSYKVTDDKQHTMEGGYLFVVIGDGFDGHEYRFNDLELITDKKEYAPGDKVKLLINTNRADGAVALFVRPSNGVYLPPKIIRLDGKSHLEEIAIVQRDMPNVFIEALTVANGKVYTEVKEVVVPPEKRVLNVDVVPSQTEYKPGAPATVQVKLTGLDGKPYVGSTVITMYDKALEYISGGSNVPEIKEFFWKWRRHHTPQTRHSLERVFANLNRPKEEPMQTLGVFGDNVVEESGRPRVKAIRRGGMGGGAMPPGAMMNEFAEGAAAPAAPMALGAPVAAAAKAADAAPAYDGGGAALQVQPVLRTNFADSAFWAGSVTTNAEGMGEVSLTMPENLTGWKVKVWGLSHGTRVGQGEVEVTTKKNLLIRLQAPRFFVQTDEVVLSANVHNYLKSAKAVDVVLELGGDTLAPMTDLLQKINIPAGGEQRVDWRVKVTNEGEAVIRMKALTDEESDAMQMTFPAYIHGMLKTESFSGAIRPDQNSGKLTFNVPAERRINDSRLEVRYSPSLAGAMVDALPYMVEYPYGCTEQTLNRFLPTVITQRVLQKMQLDLKAIGEKRTNLNAQEIGDDRERAKGWKRFDRNPVFEADEVDLLVKTNLQALTSMQLSDGGWGWFSGYGEQSWPHTTATVVHGLQIAKQNDIALVPGVLERGVEWLTRYQTEQVQWLKNHRDNKKDVRQKSQADELDALVYMVLTDADVANADMQEFLYRDRVELAVYAKALFGLALHKLGQAEKLAMILQNIDQFLVQDNENQTAYLKLPENNWWWYWYGSDIEANAYYLKLLSKTDPKGTRAPGLVKYLLNNRKHATYWNNTRDTSLCIEAMADFMAASGEDQPNLTLEVLLDGKVRKEVTISRENLFTFDNQFVLFGDAVESGEHTLELRKNGTGPIYFNAYLTNFTQEEMITKAGLEIKVQRKAYKLTPVDKQADVAGSRGQAAKQKVEKYDRTELVNGAMLKSGDLVEIELEIDSKNDYEYLVFEDMKAAGFEPVDIRSGYTGNDLHAYVEFRDERVAFFARRLTRGKHSVSYRLRAEIPGKFSALPTRGSAMYAPELKANSDEIKLSIED